MVATQTFFIFIPIFWGNDPIWRAYFSNGLVQPPTRGGFNRKFDWCFDVWTLPWRFVCYRLMNRCFFCFFWGQRSVHKPLHHTMYGHWLWRVWPGTEHQLNKTWKSSETNSKLAPIGASWSQVHGLGSGILFQVGPVDCLASRPMGNIALLMAKRLQTRHILAIMSTNAKSSMTFWPCHVFFLNKHWFTSDT